MAKDNKISVTMAEALAGIKPEATLPEPAAAAEAQ